MTDRPRSFSGTVIRWQQAHGRSGLPWQGTRDPYRVWLSEIMLQQTQVVTVLGYYERFLARFPDVAALAAATEDEVFALWSGLGYYSRARNLHRCAQEVVSRFGGAFPADAAQLQSLPGIGRTTAAAIAAFCFGQREAILDGNVKRVLTRWLGWGHDLAIAAHERALWNEATALLPATRLAVHMPLYTQGVMDLGAQVCLPRQPRCEACPLQPDCVAHAQGEPTRYPVKTRKLKRSAQSLWLLLARRNDGAVWLHKRPSRGVWAGLYMLPVFDSREALASALPRQTSRLQDGQPFVHVLTHKDLHLHPVAVALRAPERLPLDGDWYLPADWSRLGLPRPAMRLLDGD